MKTKTLAVIPFLMGIAILSFALGRLHVIHEERKSLHKIVTWHEPAKPTPEPTWKPTQFSKFDVMGDGFHQYKRDLKTGKWVEDKEGEKRLADDELAKAKLISDLGTRKLTHEELMKVTPRLNIQNMVGYFACVKYAELYDQLIRQWELQTGHKWIGAHLSATLGEYNRCPQEYDNKYAVEQLIARLQNP